MTGHRGQVVAGGPPENSLAAVAAALDQGADGVEVDVRVSADGVAVCSHDPDLGRLAGVAALVRETAYAELARLPLAGGHRIARLDEVAHLVRGRGQLIVEVKVDAYAPVRSAAATLAAVARTSTGSWPTTALPNAPASRVVRCGAGRSTGSSTRGCSRWPESMG